MNNDKKYNIVLGLMIFFFILFVAVCIAWGLGFIGVNKADLEVNNTEIEDNNDVKNDSGNIDNSNAKEENRDKLFDSIENLDVLGLDSSKCLNGFEDASYKVLVESGNGYYLNHNNGKITIDITGTNHVNNTYEIKGISSENVSECFLLGHGHALIYPIAFFLMKDGTVEWFDIEDAVKNNDFNSEGKIENVSNVVRIVNANVGYKEGGGHVTIIGIRSDGTFYDLALETVDKQ